MKKILFLICIMVSFQSFSANAIVSLVDQLKYGQYFCDKTTSEKAKHYIENNTAHSLNFCMDNISDNKNYFDDFDALLAADKSNPKKYDYYIGSAYIYGLGVNPDLLTALSWMTKAMKLGNEKAEYAYFILLSSGASDACNKNSTKCFTVRKNKLEKLGTARAYEILASSSEQLSEQCKYNKKSVELGSIDAYPAYVACYIDSENKPMTDTMHDKLNQIFSDPSTSLYTKAAAADLLGKKKEAELLYSVVQ